MQGVRHLRRAGTAKASIYTYTQATQCARVMNCVTVIRARTGMCTCIIHSVYGYVRYAITATKARATKKKKSRLPYVRTAYVRKYDDDRCTPEFTNEPYRYYIQCTGKHADTLIPWTLARTRYHCIIGQKKKNTLYTFLCTIRVYIYTYTFVHVRFWTYLHVYTFIHSVRNKERSPLHATYTTSEQRTRYYIRFARRERGGVGTVRRTKEDRQRKRVGTVGMKEGRKNGRNEGEIKRETVYRSTGYILPAPLAH